MSSENNFWNDETVKEAISFLSKKFSNLNEYQDGWEGINKEIEKFKASKILVKDKDYEIVAYSNKNIVGNMNGGIRYKRENGMFYFPENSINQFPCEETVLQNWDIHSVKRLSDGEVFSIGDTVYYDEDGDKFKHRINWKIDNFYIRQDGVMLARNKGTSQVETIDKNCYLKKLKQPEVLFTEDGVKKYNDDTVWVVNDSFCKFNRIVGKQVWPTDQPFKFFHFEANAKEYILMNKPCLSVSDIKKECVSRDFIGTDFLVDKLLNLVKQKQNL